MYKKQLSEEKITRKEFFNLFKIKKEFNYKIIERTQNIFSEGGEANGLYIDLDNKKLNQLIVFLDKWYENLCNVLNVKPNTYQETALQTTIYLILEILLVAPLHKVVPIGNSIVEDKDSLKRLMNSFQKKPFGTLLLIGVVVPSIEEIIFRYLPSRFLAGKNSEMRWGIGIGSSLLFSLAHNIDGKDHFKFRKYVPLTQLIGGIFFWYLTRKRGFSHALLSHSLHNSFLGGIMGVAANLDNVK
jgi:membrane protease YdiL (CAAX protease family)